MNAALNRRLTRLGHAMRRHGGLIRRLQWLVVLVYAAPDSAGAFAVSLIGQSAKQAKAAIAEAGYEARVVSVDGDVRPVTMDYRPDRINLTIVDKVVTKATVG